MDRIYMNRIEGQQRIAEAREALAGYMGGKGNDPSLALLLNEFHAAVARETEATVRASAGIRDAARQAAGQPTAGPPSPSVFLATPCDNCDHALNWHGNSAACIFAFCGCGRFRAPETPAVGGQDATPPAEAPLTATERQFLTFALDLASDRMACQPDDFDDEDEAAQERLYRLANGRTP